MKPAFNLTLFILLIGLFAFAHPTNEAVPTKFTNTITSNILDNRLKDTFEVKDTLSPKLDEIVHFLDSIGIHPAQPFLDSLNYYGDEIEFDSSQIPKAEDIEPHTLSSSNFRKLRNACQAKSISVKEAKRIFPYSKIEDKYLAQLAADSIEIQYCSIATSEGFEEFTVFLFHYPPWAGDLYVFKGNKAIKKIEIASKFGIEIKNFTDSIGNRLFYFENTSDEGACIVESQLVTYQYSRDSVSKVLDIPCKISNASGIRWYRLDYEVISHHPLNLKYMYEVGISTPDSVVDVLSDSTIVPFKYDSFKKQFTPNFIGTKLNMNRLLSLDLSNNEMLFVHSFHDELKKMIFGQDKGKRTACLFYLNEIMNGRYYRCKR